MQSTQTAAKPITEINSTSIGCGSLLFSCEDAGFVHSVFSFVLKQLLR